MLFFLLVCAQVWAQDEARAFARIISCVDAKQDRAALAQIEGFLETYPDTRKRDSLWEVRGDLAMRAAEFRHAFECYNQITHSPLRRRCRIKRWEAIYQMGALPQLYREIAPLAQTCEVKGSILPIDSRAEREQRACFFYASAALHEEHFEEALGWFARLVDIPLYAQRVKVQMAHIYAHLGHELQAGRLLLELAEEKKDSTLLFQAATLFVKCNPEQAISIFSHLAQDEGPHKAESLVYWFQLLASTQNFAPLFAHEKLFVCQLPKEQRPLFHYYLGYFAAKKRQWKKALFELESSLRAGLRTPYESSALETLIFVAAHESKIAALDEAYQKHRQLYGACVSTLLLRARAYRKVKLEPTAPLYKELLGMPLSDNLRESCTWELIEHLVERGDYVEAHRVACDSSLEDEKIQGLRLELALRVQDIALISEDLSSASVLSEEKRFSTSLALARIYIQQERFESARHLLEGLELLDPTNAELFYLHALSYLYERTKPELVVEYGEKALVLDEEWGEELHLPLFNVYVQLAKKQDEPGYKQRAAAHLFYAQKMEKKISLDNRLWLTQLFVSQARMGLEEDRAIFLLEDLLVRDEDLLTFEKQVVILASLYEKQKEIERAISLLTRTLVAQDKQEKRSFSMRDRCQLQLAKLYCKSQRNEEALELLGHLSTSPHLDVGMEAKLYLARLSFPLANLGQKNEILETLRELWVRKTLANEPMHLEAALDFVDFSSSLVEADQRSETLLALLRSVKQDFSQEEDLWSKDYHASRRMLEEKDEIYQAYMRYIDARIYLLEAQIAKRKGRLGESKAKRHKARVLFSTLKMEEDSDYLVEKSQTIMGGLS